MDKIQQAIYQLLVFILGVNGLINITKIDIPSMVRSGDSVTLACIYHMQYDLYVIKWYFNGHEFYRYVPKSTPRQEYFNVENIKIDLVNSDQHEVTLYDVSSDISGIYVCEVSEDFPSYYTAKKQGEMKVVDVPDTDPMIIVQKSKVRVNEILRANCTSGASDPAPNITWTLNGEQVGITYINSSIMPVKIHNRTIQTDGNLMAQSILEIQTSSELFPGGWLRLRCFVTIGSIYTATAEYNVLKDNRPIPPITGDASPHLSKNGCGTTLLGTLETKRMRTFRLIVGAILILKFSIASR